MGQILEREITDFEFPTVPIVRSTPLWFRVSLDGLVGSGYLCTSIHRNRFKGFAG
jgi:hypothetical protein